MSREGSDEKKLLDQSREYVQKQVNGNGNSALNWRMLIRWMQSKSSNSLIDPPRITGEGISAMELLLDLSTSRKTRVGMPF